MSSELQTRRFYLCSGRGVRWEEVGSGNGSRDFWEVGPFPARGAALIQCGVGGVGNRANPQTRTFVFVSFESFRVSLAALAAERVLPGSLQGGPPLPGMAWDWRPAGAASKGAEQKAGRCCLRSVCSFSYSFNKPVEHLLCARLYSMCRKYSSEQIRHELPI